MFLIFFRNILFPQQLFPRLRTEETILTGICDVGCISSIEHAQTFVFIEKILGLPGKETLCPTRLRAQETLENCLRWLNI